MATKKLSEALAELQAAASVSGLDVRLVVAGQSSTDNAQTITLQQLLTALNVPTVQTSANGTTKNYIYSASSDEMHTALSGKIWTYTHTDRNLFLRFKHWGAANDTEQTNYSQVLLCHLVNRNQDGLMDKYVFARVLNHNLAEGQSTTDKVIVNYTNFAESGNKQLVITKATTAKAGVMTAADKQLLEQIKTKLGL